MLMEVLFRIEKYAEIFNKICTQNSRIIKDILKIRIYGEKRNFVLPDLRIIYLLASLINRDVISNCTTRQSALSLNDRLQIISIKKRTGIITFHT